MRTKGIIITSDFGSHSDGNTMWYGGVNTSELRQHLLYFDKIHWPDEKLLGFNQTFEDQELLLKEKILIKRQVDVLRFSTKNYGAENLKALLQLSAFLQNNKNDSEEWAIAQPSNYLVLPDEHSIEQQTVEVSLYKCLPTPKADTKIEDILKFKNKRGSELQALRYALDSLYLEIINSNDIPRSKNHAIQNIELTLSDLETVLKESSIKHYLSSFDVSLNFNAFNLALGGAMGAAGITYGLPVVGTMFTSLLSFIRFKVDLFKKPKGIPDKIKDYAYAHDVMKHL